MSDPNTEAQEALRVAVVLAQNFTVGGQHGRVAAAVRWAGELYEFALEQAGRALEQERETVQALYERAEREPLGVDISDYSDEYCTGFLDGQTNALDTALSALG